MSAVAAGAARLIAHHASLRLVTFGALECHGPSGRLRQIESEPLLGGLLAYLAVTRRASMRELTRIFFRQGGRNGDLILPVVESIQEQAGPGILQRTGDLICADEGLEADARWFEAAHREGDYGVVLDAYAGPFLPGAERAQSEQFAHWVDTCRRRYAAMHMEARERVRVCRVFEAVGDEVLLVDWRGTVLYRSPGLAPVLADCAGGPALLRHVQGLGRTVAVEDTDTLTLELPCGGHRLRVSAVPMPASGSEPVCVVVVRRLGTGWPTRAALQTTFGLTQRQARVAILIAEGRTNGDIAEELSISPHTARRHTEAVLEKLGLRTRSGVAARLLAAKAKIRD